jgi:hypothetical protein
MAVPRLEAMVVRLRMARHDAALEDRLDASPPTLLLSVRPWRGPWTQELAPPRGTLAIVLHGGPEEHIVVRFSLDSDAEEPAREMRVSPARISAVWLERVVVEFVERLLARA